jgi:Tol biopolymer transport system component
MRRTFVSLGAIVAALVAAPPAAASYGARSARLLWEQQSWSYDTGSQTAAILDGSGALTSCDNASGDQLCKFGRPTLSPNGRRVIVSRHPQAGFQAPGIGPGTLELIDAERGSPRTLPQLTASDTQPAFLPGGQRIVFTGRRTPKGPSQLYEANVDGSGLRQLTFRGGSWAAPCANGAIVFERGADLWLIPARGKHWTRLVRGGSEPDCAPDSRRVVYVTRNHSRLALIGLNGRGGKVLPHGRGAAEETDRPGELFSPAFSPDGRSIAYIRSYDVLQQDGSRDELDICDLSGRIRSRRDVADQAGGSLGSDAQQSSAQYVGW